MIDDRAPERVRVGIGGVVDIGCIDIASISLSKGLFFTSVQIRSRTRNHVLSGLSAGVAAKIEADLRAFVNNYLLTVVGTDADLLREIDAFLRSFTAGNSRYLAGADLARAVARVPGRAGTALIHPLLDPSLLSRALNSILPSSFALLTDPAVRQRYNETFVASELSRFKPFFDDLDGRSLSGQQREACIRLEDTNLLVASAGSGKSATMVAKVAYVIEKQLYRPDEILVLAFNKSAADEIRHRIAKQFDVDPADLETKVTTFHALGRAIIKEVNGRPPQLANWVGHLAAEAKFIEGLIEQLSRSNPSFLRSWIDLLVLHPKSDIPAQVFDDKADYRRYVSDRREKGNATIGTLAGIYVKSLQEQKIANWLWLNSVQFEYETQVPLTQADGTTVHVHPDFFYPATGTIHEHFAIDADGSSPFENYVERADGKRAAYTENALDFFETLSAQASDGTLFGVLEKQLGQRGISTSRRDLREIEQALQPVVVKHYHQLVGTCVKHIRASHLSLDMLMARAERVHDKERAKRFASLIWEITQAYSQELENIGRIDFDSMIGDATHFVETGQYQSPFSLILVDEFQDISEPSAKLVRALKGQNPFAKLFAVGDDWQSIYRFAGSDITLFTRFEESFGTSWIGRLEQTYRSNQFIAQTAATFVQRNPEQLRKQVTSTRPAIPKSIRVVPVDDERGKPNFGKACEQLLERLDAFLGGIAHQWRSPEVDKLKALILWRYNHLAPFKTEPPTMENIEVVGMSFHRAKGLEADYTIILDVSEGDYGVPSRIEDDELLSLVIPRPEAFPNAEERRLFYVALTRARRGVFLLTNARSPSHYISELSEASGASLHFETVDGTELEQCPVCRAGHMVDRRAKTGLSFSGCSQYPECKHTSSADGERRRAARSAPARPGPHRRAGRSRWGDGN